MKRLQVGDERAARGAVAANPSVESCSNTPELVDANQPPSKVNPGSPGVVMGTAVRLPAGSPKPGGFGAVSVAEIGKRLVAYVAGKSLRDVIVIGHLRTGTVAGESGQGTRQNHKYR